MPYFHSSYSKYYNPETLFSLNSLFWDIIFPTLVPKLQDFAFNFTKLLFTDYLLSNNHVNAIIVHKFDFSDEEVMAYYISFLKTLSFRLNKHTIHFFYNEVRLNSITNDYLVDIRKITSFHFDYSL
jgi:hypothetical protein